MHLVANSERNRNSLDAKPWNIEQGICASYGSSSKRACAESQENRCRWRVLAICGDE